MDSILLLLGVLLSTTLLPGSKAVRCYWCNGVGGQSSQCQMTPSAVNSGPVFVDCHTKYCVSLKVMDAQSGQVNAFSRLCADIPRGNVCVRDAKLITCFQTCAKDFCNHGNPDPTNLGVKSHAEIYLGLMPPTSAPPGRSKRTPQPSLDEVLPIGLHTFSDSTHPRVYGTAVNRHLGDGFNEEVIVKVPSVRSSDSAIDVNNVPAIEITSINRNRKKKPTDSHDSIDTHGGNVGDVEKMAATRWFEASLSGGRHDDEYDDDGTAHNNIPQGRSRSEGSPVMPKPIALHSNGFGGDQRREDSESKRPRNSKSQSLFPSSSRNDVTFSRPIRKGQTKSVPRIATYTGIAPPPPHHSGQASSTRHPHRAVTRMATDPTRFKLTRLSLSEFPSAGRYDKHFPQRAGANLLHANVNEELASRRDGVGVSRIARSPPKRCDCVHARKINDDFEMVSEEGLRSKDEVPFHKHSTLVMELNRKAMSPKRDRNLKGKGNIRRNITTSMIKTKPLVRGNLLHGRNKVRSEAYRSEFRKNKAIDSERHNSDDEYEVKTRDKLGLRRWFDKDWDAKDVKSKNSKDAKITIGENDIVGWASSKWNADTLANSKLVPSKWNANTLAKSKLVPSKWNADTLANSKLVPSKWNANTLAKSKLVPSKWNANTLANSKLVPSKWNANTLANSKLVPSKWNANTLANSKLVPSKWNANTLANSKLVPSKWNADTLANSKLVPSKWNASEHSMSLSSRIQERMSKYGTLPRETTKTNSDPVAKALRRLALLESSNGRSLGHSSTTVQETHSGHNHLTQLPIYPNSESGHNPLTQVPTYPNSESGHNHLTQVPTYPNSESGHNPLTQVPTYPNSESGHNPLTQVPTYPNSESGHYPLTQVPTYPNSGPNKNGATAKSNFHHPASRSLTRPIGSVVVRPNSKLTNSQLTESKLTNSQLTESKLTNSQVKHLVSKSKEFDAVKFNAPTKASKGKPYDHPNPKDATYTTKSSPTNSVNKSYDSFQYVTKSSPTRSVNKSYDSFQFNKTTTPKVEGQSEATLMETVELSKGMAVADKRNKFISAEVQRADVKRLPPQSVVATRKVKGYVEAATSKRVDLDLDAGQEILVEEPNHSDGLPPSGSRTRSRSRTSTQTSRNGARIVTTFDNSPRLEFELPTSTESRSTDAHHGVTPPVAMGAFFNYNYTLSQSGFMTTNPTITGTATGIASTWNGSSTPTLVLHKSDSQARQAAKNDNSFPSTVGSDSITLHQGESIPKLSPRRRRFPAPRVFLPSSAYLKKSKAKPDASLAKKDNSSNANLKGHWVSIVIVASLGFKIGRYLV